MKDEKTKNLMNEILEAMKISMENLGADNAEYCFAKVIFNKPLTKHNVH